MKLTIRLSIIILIVVQLTGCSLLQRFRPVAQASICTPQGKALINQSIANSSFCKSLAPAAILACIAKQSLADQVLLASCQPDANAAPIVTGRRMTPSGMADVQLVDQRSMMQELLESVGYSPERAMRIVRRAGM